MSRAVERLERDVARGAGVAHMLRLMRAYDDMGIVRPEHLLSGTKASVAWSIHHDERTPEKVEVRSGRAFWRTPRSEDDDLEHYSEDVRIDYPSGTAYRDRSRAELVAEVGRGRAPAAVVQLLRYEDSRLFVGRAASLEEASRWLRPDLEVHVAWCHLGWRDRVEAFSTRSGWERWVRSRIDELAAALRLSGESLEQYVREHGLSGALYELSGWPGGGRWSPGIALHYPVVPETEEPHAP